MVLVDTSVWIDHFRSADEQLVGLLIANRVLAHPMVIGEIALGSVKRRAEILHSLGNLPQALIAAHAETLTFIAQRKLANSGVGYVDAALLASAALTPSATLWTRDKAVYAVALRIDLAAPFH